MPIIKSAKKALRQSRKRTILNKARIEGLKAELKKLKKQKDPESLKKVFSLVDKMVKNKLIHKNKAGRVKSQASLLVTKTIATKTLPKKTTKKKTS